MTRPPDDHSKNSHGEDKPDFGVEDLQPSRRSRPAAPAVGPSDVAESVKAELRAAFDEQSSPPRPGTRPAIKANQSKLASSHLDETGPVDVLGEHSDVDEPEDQSKRSRRRFRDIAREHDTRLKSQTVSESRTDASPKSDVKVDSKIDTKSEPTVKVSDDGKKRVVITDEEVVNIKRSAPKEERKRKKTRRGSDEVIRLPNRRWWSRTASGSWRLKWYSVVGIVVVGVLLVLLLLTSPLLSIRKIDVEGVVYTNQARLDEVLVQLKGDAILTADLHGATRQIEAIAWVRRARVSMHLPSTVVVQIDERQPVAFFRAVDGFIRVVDREGRILDVIEGDPIDYTRIIGSGPNLAPGDFVGQPFLGAVELLGALPVSLADRLVSATVSPEGEISLQLTPNLLIIFGQPTDFQVKLVAVVNEMKRQGSRSYTVIDVSTGEPNVR
ncbi:MAG: cell division protein FtsQ/DivIB [Actinomycetota bacterium]